MDFKAVAHGMLLSLCLSPEARAQVTIDAGKITCQQFVQSKIAAIPIAAAWLSGYYHGKAGNPSIDLQQLQGNVDKLEHYCRQEKNFKQPVMQAIEQLFVK